MISIYMPETVGQMEKQGAGNGTRTGTKRYRLAYN